MKIAPHPTLRRYYETDAERSRAVDELFEAGAPYYETICRIMSLGTGESYRRRALRNAGLEAGMRILDVATGTGLMLRSAAAMSGENGLAVGLDPCVAMLRECQQSCVAPLIRGIGEFLPFADSSFHMLSMGYALRHVADLRALFEEYRRVLKPGGKLLILEMTPRQSAVGRWLAKLYLGTLVPGLARLAGGGMAARRMMAYYWDTVSACVPPEVILVALHDAGFPDAKRRVHCGILSEYVATKR